MLTAHNVTVRGRHYDLLPTTDLHVKRGSLLLAAAGRQEQRTTAGLVLTGRMAPDAGQLMWEQDPDLTHLRHCSALIDAPEVTEPEPHFRVRDLIGESLALIPARHKRPHVRQWWEGQQMTAPLDEWVERLPVQERIELLCELALADPAVQLLVIDSPDRHNPYWPWEYLQQRANNPSRPLSIIALVSRCPVGWQGPTVDIPDPLRSAP